MIQLQPPKFCDACCSLNVKLQDKRHFSSKDFGDRNLLYYCSDCKAMVGCHPGTDLPLGRMADKLTRQLRIEAHREFDVLWQRGHMERDRAYQWLAVELSIELDLCHIGLLTNDQLKDVCTLSANFIQSHAEVLRRRRAKRYAKQTADDRGWNRTAEGRSYKEDLKRRQERETKDETAFRKRRSKSRRSSRARRGKSDGKSYF